MIRAVRHKKLIGLAIILFAMFSTIATVAPSHAQVAGWFGPKLFFNSQPDTAYSLSLMTRNCRLEDNVRTIDGNKTLCVTRGSKVNFGYDINDIYVSKGYDQRYYKLALGDTYPILTPGSDNALGLVANRNVPNSIRVVTYDDLASRIVFNVEQYYYELRASNPRYQSDDISAVVTLPRLSKNGKYIAFAQTFGQNDIVFRLINTQTGDVKTIGRPVNKWLYASENYRDIAISDDGQYVAASTVAQIDNNSKTTRTVQLWRTDNCDVYLGIHCETRIASEGVLEKDLPKIFTPSGIEFDDTGGKLTVTSYDTQYGQISNYHLTTFSTAEIFNRSRIDYLAMGDSYSSGEGDIYYDDLSIPTPQSPKPYYIKGTNEYGNSALSIPQEMCHVSSNSYPFVLQKELMKESSMISVACSGATVINDYTNISGGVNADYLGQGERLEVFSSDKYKLNKWKSDALEISHIPGRNKQIEFVKRYQPVAITITGGGNDAGFEDVIKACALPIGSCGVVTDNKKKQAQGEKIQDTYSKLVELYKETHKASPRTKIYAVGYPQFVSDKADPCALNVGLNQVERKFIRQAVSYMNTVTRVAADTAGVKYIDIENSLGNDNILCGGLDIVLPYVTGITVNSLWRLFVMSIFSSESFHPNMLGHSAMASTIAARLGEISPAQYNYCSGGSVVCPKIVKLDKVPLPPFFDVGSSENTTQAANITEKSTIQKSAEAIIKIFAQGFGVGLATIRMESTPRTLGMYEVKEDGIIDVSYNLPDDIPAGEHTLYVDTVTPSGEPITLWQSITIMGKQGDIDENGVPDNEQPCPYVIGPIIDNDEDEVDDRCDLVLIKNNKASKVVPNLTPADSLNIAMPTANSTVHEFFKPEAQQAIWRFLGYTLPVLSKDSQEQQRSTLSTPAMPKHQADSQRTNQPTNIFTNDIKNILLAIVIFTCIISTIIGVIYGKIKKTSTTKNK